MNERDEVGTPLLARILDKAATTGDRRSRVAPVDAVKVVLAAGADPDAADESTGRAPLMSAMDSFGWGPTWRDVISMLLARGADANKRSDYGLDEDQTPLMLAVQFSGPPSFFRHGRPNSYFAALRFDMIHRLLRNGADCSQGELEECKLRGRPRTLLEMFDETEFEYDDDDDDDDGIYHPKARALLVGVAAAGSWKKYLHEPRVRLDTLRVLCARGPAVPPSGPLARLFPLWGGDVPLGVFRTILCFWHSDRDELPCCEESAPFLSYRRSRGTAS